jgi:SAM-dependent methyltransferase
MIAPRRRRGEAAVVQRPSWAPAEVDIDRPASSRIYDVFLGGSHNFAADRQLADRAVAHMPELPAVLREGRAFLRRAVRFLAVKAGLCQFLDLGSGMPTAGNVHEIAQQVDPTNRVAYVDIDPVTVAHSRAILADNRYATMIRADLRHPLQILRDPQVEQILDFNRPVAVLLLASLHFVADHDDPAGIVAQLRRVVAPGSYLAIAHASDDGQPPAGLGAAQDVYAQPDSRVVMRSRAQIEALFTGWELVPPGLTRTPLWRPDPDATPPAQAAEFPGFAGVAKSLN